METFDILWSSPCISVGSVKELRTGGHWFDPIFLPTFYDRHCDSIHPSLIAVHYFDDDYVGDQSVAWMEYV